MYLHSKYGYLLCVKHRTRHWMLVRENRAENSIGFRTYTWSLMPNLSFISSSVKES